MNSVWYPLPCFLSKCPLKRVFLDIYLTKFFGFPNFKYTSTIRVIMFWKCSKLNLYFKNAGTNWEKKICFWDNCIWIGCIKLSLIRRKHLSVVVNVLKNSLMPLYITKRDFFHFQLTCLVSGQKISSRWCG